MSLTPEFLLAGGGMLISGGIAWGVLKGSMSNYVKHSDHRMICHDKSDETNKKIDLLFKKLDETNSEFHELNGWIKGKMDH
jgi:hypothetical protein